VWGKPEDSSDGIDQFIDLDNFTYEFTELGTHYIKATVTNGNGTDYKNWTVLVEPETIDVTLSNFPVYFGNISSDGSTYPSLSPLGVGNLSYSNSSGGSRTNMTTSFPLSSYDNWINITK